MSRSGYVDEPYDYRLHHLWRGAVKRTFNGKRGQAFLKELLKEMDAMPDKWLISDELIDSEGNCCTLGVICKSRGLDVEFVDECNPDDVGKLLGISMAMAAEIQYENDYFCLETPEHRFPRMRNWIESKVQKEEK